MNHSMRRRIFVPVFAASIGCLACVNALNAQTDFWQQTSGPYGGIVHAVAVDPSGRIFAGFYYSGLFRSTDNGATWAQVSSGSVRAVSINSSEHVFVGGGPGVLRSTDHGQTWSQITTGLTNRNVWSLAINSSGYVFAGTFGGGVFRSTDNGEIWSQANAGLTNSVVRALVVNSTGEIFAGTDNGVFRSSDNGDSWMQLTLVGNTVNALAINSADHVFAGTQWGAGVFRSTDNGGSWTPVFSNSPVFALATGSAGKVFAGTGNGVFRSLDNGDTWTQVNAGLTNTLTRSLIVTPAGDVVAGTNGGIFRSTDNGENWTELSVTATVIFSLDASPNGHVFAGVYGDGVARSSDNGANWTRVNSGLTQPYVEALAINSSGHIFVGTQSGVFRSTDNGGSWTLASSGLPGFQFLYDFAFNASGHIFAGGQIYDFQNNKYVAAVFRSTDNGDTWANVNSGLTAYAIRSLAINSAGHIFAAGPTETWGGVIFHSTDNGETWTQLHETLSGFISCLAINSHGDIFAGVSSWEGVYRSTDNGLTWERINTGLEYEWTNTYIYSLAINSQGHIFAGTYFRGVFRSTDNGAIWEQVSTGMGNSYVLSLAVSSDDYLFAGTYGRGIYRSVESTAPRNTAVGTEVAVRPVDETSQTQPITFTFDQVTTSGNTGLAITSTGPAPPADFRLGDPATYYEVSTTASYSGTIELRVDYSSVSYSDESTLKLFHFVDGEWVDITTSLDMDQNLIYGVTSSLSPFAVFELDVIKVQIDIKPGSFANAINPGSKGVIPVAILTTSEFDARTVDPLSVKFGPNDATEVHNMGHIEDVDGDGDLDLMLHFAIQATGIKEGDMSATLTGKTFNGKSIKGSDEIVTVGKSGSTTSPGENISFEVESVLPATFDLSPNYPNPFNPSTTIRYQIPKSAPVSLKIYNVLGEVVATLVDQIQEAGYYEVRWSPKLPSGIYLYRLQAGEFIQARKLTVVK